MARAYGLRRSSGWARTAKGYRRQMPADTRRSLYAGLLAAVGALVFSLGVRWLDLGVVWSLVALWAIGTVSIVGYVVMVARRQRRVPTVRMLWRRTDAGIPKR